MLKDIFNLTLLILFGPDVRMHFLNTSPYNFSWNLLGEFVQIWHSVLYSFDIYKKWLFIFKDLTK